MAKKKETAPSGSDAPKKDLELQNAVIALLETGTDEGSPGVVVVNVEEFRKVQELLIDRTGETYGSLSDDNVDNNVGDTEFDTDEFDDDDEEEDEEWDDGEDD